MKDILNNMNDILSLGISGFHQYVLTDPVHIGYASKNLCDMLGITEDELLSETEDKYALMVHHADRETYSEFINNMKQKEQTVKAEYRLIKKSGEVIYVCDTVTVKKDSDGILSGYSVLTDITEIKKKNDNLQFLNETIPCGFLKYTCEKQPKVTYINRQMMEFLRFPEAKEGELDYLELFKANIFLMIPMEERRRFSLYLNRVYSAGTPLAGEMTILRCDGTRAYMFGWVTKCVNEQGVEEFQSVCIDITERHQAKKANETRRYLKALTDVYDKIFEYDLGANTVKCLYSSNSPMFKWLENIPMQMEDATEKWISGTVVDEDRDRLRSFFKDFCQKKLYKPDARPPRITYRAQSSSGDIKTYGGIFLKIDNSVSLYCCRSVQDDKEADYLRNENVSLKENMHELVMRFTDGVAAFEVKDGYVTPLYASDNVCEFFGFTKEEWLPLMKKSTPIKDFVARSDAAYEEIVELLKNGEAEFTYFDLKSETERRIKAICSHKSPSSSSPRYIMLYNVEDTGTEKGLSLPENRTVSIRTFGYFDVFVGDKAVAFRNKKSKELFALLVDRRGGFVSSEEAISFLWEDELVNSVTLARYRKVALRLKNILEEYGISDVMETVDGKRRIVTEKVRCDLYDYLSGKEEFAQLFKGNYLTNYSWGENTLAELTGNILY
jgi:PAS domain S-box-containing protein